MTLEMTITLLVGAGAAALLLLRFSPVGRRWARRTAARRARERRQFPRD